MRNRDMFGAMIALVIVLPVLAACTTVEDFYTACARANATIAGQVGCVKANMMEQGSLADDTLAQEYLRTGDLLVLQVEEGKLSEQEAQLKFVESLNRIRRDDLRERAYQAEIDRAHRELWPRQTDCYETGGGRITCTSF